MPRWLKQHRWLVVVIIVPALFLLAQACSSSDNNASNTPVGKGGTVQAMAAMFFPASGRIALREAIEQGIIDKFLFVDGTKSQSMFDDLGVAKFEGMQGTAPGAANATFDTAYKNKTGKSPTEVNYTREGYDATYMIALAAVAANSS